MTFEQKLKGLRLAHNLSQEQLGKKIGVSAASIGFWENGKRSPKIKQVIKIAHVFGVEWQDLMGDYLSYGRIFRNDPEESIMAVYKQLNEEGQQMLMSYAQFLLNNPMYGTGTTSMRDAFLYDGAKDQKALEDLTENEKVTLASHPSTKEKK